MTFLCDLFISFFSAYQISHQALSSLKGKHQKYQIYEREGESPVQFKRDLLIYPDRMLHFYGKISKHCVGWILPYC